MPGGLRTVTTQAVRSIREETDVHGHEPLIRQVLNLQQLTQIVLYGHLQDDDRPVKSGKKRLAPAASGSTKRAKADALSLDRNSGAVASAEAERRLSVYAHKFELAYTTTWRDGEAGVVNPSRRYANNQRATDLGWLQEEKQFIEALTGGGALSPRTFELGDVTLRDHWGVTQLYIGSQPQGDDDEHYYLRYLATLPTCAFPKHLQRDRPGSVLQTCLSLLQSGHISMSASASLLYIPGIVEPELPIQLHVTVHVSLVVPTIFSSPTFQVPSTMSVEGQRRRLLSYLFFHDPAHTDDGFREEEREEGLKELRHFYSILEPAPLVSSPMIHNALQPRALCATLLPFQRRTVKWLLERERKTIDLRGRVVPHVESLGALPLFWRPVQIPGNATTAVGESLSHEPTWYYNLLTGSLSENFPPGDNISGAMLCEEMGLGKTLECIALMLLNPAVDRNPATTRWDTETELEVNPVKTNLIVTPSTLSQQWLDELSRHAPALKVLSYTGYNKVKIPKKFKVDDQEDVAGQSETHRLWCSYFQGFDVIVTTYNVLSQELGVAKAPIMRPKRQVASYSHVEKPRSPLVRVEWARVFMDEVQLVGGGKTAEMVSLIPRDVSVAVSGTPAKSKVSDLYHVLKFLRVEQAVRSTKTWDTLLKPEFGNLFSELFKKYAVRTLKSRVKDELAIPSQTRFAVGIEFGKAERHIYDLTLEEALHELGVDGRGVATSQGWELDISLLRSWLRRLRQVCTHPQVGIVKNNKVSARSISVKTIKTIEEVLQGYQEHNWNSLITETKNKIQIRIRRAQLVQTVNDDLNRYRHARDLLSDVQLEVEQLLHDVKIAIAAQEEKGREIMADAIARRRERRELNANRASQVTNSKGKGKARGSGFSDEEDSEDDGLPRTQIGDEYRAKQRNLQGRLREVYVLQHKVTFLLGDVYHMLGITIQEEALYAAAESVRRTLLKSSEESAISAIAKLPPKSESIIKKDLNLSLCQKGGIRSAELMEEANEVLELLNEQGKLLWQWRTRIFALLTQKLSSPEGDQPDGEEYTRTLDTQGEVEVYLQAYAALIADRKEVLIAERTALAVHDAHEAKARETLAARNADHPTHASGDIENVELEAENQVLQHELAEERKALREGRSKRALKAIMFQLNEIGNRAGNRLEENYLAKEEGKRLRKIIADQGDVMEMFESELASFRKVFNERIQYFRQLQELSDSVVQPQWEGNVRDAIELSKAEEEKAILQVNAKRAGQRHFMSLAKDKAEGELEEDDCVLCGEAFQRGLMTPCGHIFCEECLTRWLKHRGRQTYWNCPMCRTNIDMEALQRISLNDADHKKQLNIHGEPKPSPGRDIKFNTLPQSISDEIETFEAYGSYGSKITHLVRHLLYLQSQEPGTKSVIFSAWSDSLTIIQKALVDNGIRSIRVDQKGKQDAAQMFKSDPELLVFLLHGERENAGLNLTCAKRVWLIEPTVNHAFEMQAISRVDRMGQTSATEVFCYYIQDTVEENILRMGARRNLSLYTEDHFQDAIDISEFAMGVQKPLVDSPSKKQKKEKQKGDFIAHADDLIHVLFPHLDFREEDLEHLTDFPCAQAEKVAEYPIAGPSTNILVHGNAIAGPSGPRR